MCMKVKPVLVCPRSICWHLVSGNSPVRKYFESVEVEATPSTSVRWHNLNYQSWNHRRQFTFSVQLLTVSLLIYQLHHFCPSQTTIQTEKDYLWSESCKRPLRRLETHNKSVGLRDNLQIGHGTQENAERWRWFAQYRSAGVAQFVVLREQS